MNITKRDVLELRRRLKKTECSITRICGCYVNSGKQTVLKFDEPFLDLDDEEFFKYLEIAKKTLSGSLGANLLELEFDRTDEAVERQQYLLALKQSKLKNEELIDRLYEQVIEHYAYAGNYLILIYHDVYDVMTKTTDNIKVDESEEVYEYLICSICPVELSKPGLGYREEENRIGARERDWVVGLPDLGFVYPAFSDRGSDVNAVMYYVKTGKESHPELVEQVLGCISQRTAAEEKKVFHEVIQNAFEEDEDEADTALLKIQKTISGLVLESEEDEESAPVSLTRETVSGLLAEAEVPDEARERIERSYVEAFGDMPPVAHNIVDKKMAEEAARREQTMALQQKVEVLQQRLQEATGDRADGENPPWADGQHKEIILQLPEDKLDAVETRVLDGQKCIVIPVEEGESARINGVEKEI